jgi:hypothetical protein
MEMTPEVVQPIVENASKAIKSLKKSVVMLEKFNKRLNFESDEVQVTDIETKLLVDEFFDYNNGEIAAENFKSYDIM